MVESGRVPGKGRIHACTAELSGRVGEKGRISVSTEKWQNSGEYREMLQSVPYLKNCPDEFRKMVESWRVVGKGRIRATIGKLSGRVSEKGRVSVSTRNWYNPGKYREKVESMRVSKNCRGEYQKR